MTKSTIFELAIIHTLRLARRPLSTSQVSKRTRIGYKTAKKHLTTLNDQNIIGTKKEGNKINWWIMIKKEQKFSTDWESPPGDTIKDILEDKKWTQAKFTEKMELPEAKIDLLLKGEAAITPTIALKLEQVLGSTAHFWLMRDVLYLGKANEGNNNGD